MAIHLAEKTPFLMETLCRHTNRSPLTSPQLEVLIHVLTLFREHLSQQFSCDILEMIPTELVEAVVHSSILPLQPLIPLVQVLLDAELVDCPFIEAVKIRVGNESGFSLERLQVITAIASRDKTYRFALNRVIKDYRPCHRKSHMHLITCMNLLSEFGFTLGEETSDEMDGVMERQFMAFRIEEGSEVLGPVMPFSDFISRIGTLLAEREVLIPEVDTLPKPIQLCHDLSNSSKYAISLLKHAWYTKGVNNYNTLLADDPGLIPLYLELFAQLQACRLMKYLEGQDFHNVIPLCVGSVLLRTFKLNLSALTIDPSVSLRRQATDLVRSFAGIVDHLMEKGFLPLSREIIGELTPILNSPLVKYIYGKLKIAHRDCRELVGKTFFASTGHHGITIFGGIILINDNYSSDKLKAKCGVVITLYHEFAHYCRRMQEGEMFDINQLTPTKDQTENEIYHLGPPGDPSLRLRVPTEGEAGHGEGGYQVEEELYGVVPNLVNEHQARFLTKGENWNLPHDDFKSQLEALHAVKPAELFSYRSGDQNIYFHRQDHSLFQG